MKNSLFFNASFTVILTLVLLLLFAPATMAEETSDHYAVEVISSENLGDGVLGDADAVIGEPATWCLSADFPGFPGGPFRVKLVEAPWNTDLDGNPVLAQIQDGGHITIKFDGKVHNNPANPYGVDFIIYSNAFFTGVGYVDDDTDMNDYIITSGGFNDADPGIVSVSQDGETWYTFDDGPNSKGSLFPTQAYQWDAVNAEWTDEKMDFTKAVNPALTVDDFYNKSAAEAIALYDGAGGGTGFNLNDLDVQLDWIQYVKVDALGNKTEIDAFAAVSFLEEETDETINIDLKATGIDGDIFNIEDLEIPAGEVTVGGFILDQHTAMGALAYYCQEKGINIEITEGTWGRYVYQIGDDSDNEDSWVYYVNESSPWVGADQYELSGGESVHYFNFNLSLYSLSMSIEPEEIALGETVTATVLFKDGDGEETPVEGAEIYYTDELDDFGSPVAGTLLEGVNTDAEGKAFFTWNDEGTYYFYAEWNGKSSQYQWPVATLDCFVDPDPALLDNPVLTLPVHGKIVDGTSVTLQWEPVPGATHYAVWLYNLEEKVVMTDALLVTETSYTYEGLTDNGDAYAWSIAALNAIDQTRSDYAAPIAFIDGSDADLLPPTLTLPEHNAKISGTSVQFSWEESAGASHYSVWVFNLTTNEQVELSAPMTETTYTITGLANNGDTYAWSVIASDTIVWSDFAFPRLFVNE